jgi:guanosine-3',5'-bis(diphosphate) 3'-pyrophosphohydrolase
MNTSLLTDRICRRLARELVQDAKARGHNTERLRQAIAYAGQAHKGQHRKSGEPFFIHSLQVARAVQVMGGPEVDVLAALHHDIVEDCFPITLSDIEIVWGVEVAARVGSLTKDYRLPTHEQRGADAFGRLWIAMSRYGGGVALTKLLDRAHNSCTSAVLSAEKIAQMRQENRCMYAPLARFIGAKGLARFLDSKPERWWEAAPNFVGAMAAIQPRLCLA